MIDETGNGEWIGTLFGFNVKGEGGEGDVRACKVLAVEGGEIKVEGLENETGNKSWMKIQDKVQELLNK